jgi:DNA ligase-1
MPDLADGESVEMQGSGAKPYVIKNVGGVYSCTCPAWRNQSVAIERRTCKHIRKLRGDVAEESRIGGAPPRKPAKTTAEGTETEGPPLLLAESWDSVLDLAGWWMSEKLDGVRAYWDGQQFLSRQGNIYHAPDWFIEGLPNVPLDGELWLARKSFQRTVSIVRRQDKSEHWKEIRYLVFDAPAAGTPFEERLGFLSDSLRSSKNSFVALHEHVLCRDLNHLREELQRIEALGGEGLMLRQPGSKYVPGRSATLLKVKTFHDAEAIVIGHEAGKGRHAGRLGALTVRLPNGKEFSVGTGFSDKERGAPPPVGSLITFRYQELSDAGIPRFPSYVGLRSDVPGPAATPAATAPDAPDHLSQPPIRVPAPSSTSTPDLGHPSPAETSAAQTSPAAGPARRSFEFVEGKSSKFWEVWTSGQELTTRWGRIGTNGQSKTKSFTTPAAAQAESDRLIAEKTAKGYREVLGKAFPLAEDTKIKDPTIVGQLRRG